MAAPKKDQISTAPKPPPESGLRFFREILGQDWVVSHLKTAMLTGRLSHAYLFLGPGGVGKTATVLNLGGALALEGREREEERGHERTHRGSRYRR